MFGEAFWVGLAFIVFVAAIYRPVGKMMGAALDNRAQRIQEELEEAVRLREEAQALLAGYERQQNEAVKQAEQAELPPPLDLCDDVYGEPPPALLEQRRALAEELRERGE